MAVVYGAIGVWALLDPFLNALELGYPSFLNAVGLSISSPIGYSEIAGLYGGLNFFIGLMCIVGIFKKNIGIFISDHNVQETLAITDRTYLMFEGSILKQGNPEELASDEVVRKVYLGQNFQLRKKSF